MPQIDSIARITVTRSTRTPSRAGFGVALILAYHALYADRVRSYSSLDGMVADGFTPYDPAYLAAQSYFAQTPSPTSVKVGRRALAPTQVVELTPGSPSASDVYTVKVDGLSASYTADGTPTVAEVCTGLAAAINALADVDAILATGASSGSEQVLSGSQLDGVTGYGALSVPRKITFTFSSHANWDATTATLEGLDGNGETQSESIAIPDGGNATVTSTKKYLQVTSITIPAQSGTSGTFTVGVAKPVTADGTSTTKVVCTASSGELHSYELVTSNLSLHDATTNPGIATDLAAIVAADNDFYGLLLDSNSPAEVTAAAAWALSHKKLMGYQSSESALLSSGSTSVIGYVLKATANGYCFGLYRSKLGTSDAWSAAAWMGARFSKDPGAATWKFATLAGVSVDTLTDTQRAALDGYNVNHYTSVGGVGIAAEGVCASGEFIDVTRDLDWHAEDMQSSVFGGFVSNDKISFTDEGISRMMSIVRAVLTRGVTAGVFKPGFTVTAPRAADVSNSNKATRNLPDITYQAELAGAIHSVVLDGRVSV